MDPKLSIVIPCYNEAKNLATLLQGYREAIGTREDIEVIFVNNGSQDDTEAFLQNALKKPENRHFRSVTVKKNEGYGHGILTGLKNARGQFLGWSHADQQCPPMDTLRTLEAMEATGHPERCFGKGHRTNDRGSAGLITLFQSKIASQLLGVPMIEINAQPKIFPRSLLKDFTSPPTGIDLDTYAYYKAQKKGLEIISVNVVFLDRAHGESSWNTNYWSRTKAILKGILYLLKLRQTGV